MKSTGNPHSSESHTSQKNQTTGLGTQKTATVGSGDDALEKITVLLNKHPSSANLFADGEVRCLRKLGYDIALTALESTLDLGGDLNPESEATHYLRGRLRELAVHLRAAAKPLSFFTVVYWAIRLDGWLGLLRSRHVADVLALDRWMRRHGIRHPHAHFGLEAARVAVLMKHFARSPFP